jgi:hypothetical protein
MHHDPASERVVVDPFLKPMKLERNSVLSGIFLASDEESTAALARSAPV